VVPRGNGTVFHNFFLQMKFLKMKMDIFSLLDQLGLAWTNLVNGFIGATIWAVYKKAKFWVAVRQIFVGGVVAGYSTPFLSKEISMRSSGFFSFVLGVIGMVVIENLYQWFSKKIKLLFS
jgi:uncharacterized membrane protein YeaQ/YmgE (transglycosylase-associated protein family)